MKEGLILEVDENDQRVGSKSSLLIRTKHKVDKLKMEKSV